MDASKDCENIFESVGLHQVIGSIKNAVKAGYRSEEMGKMLNDTFEVIKKITGASEIRLYRVDERMEVITLEYDGKLYEPGENLLWEVDEAPVIAAKAVRNMKELGNYQESDSEKDEVSRVFEEDLTMCISAYPVGGKSFSLLELCKRCGDNQFYERDKKIVGAIVDWLDKNLSSAISSQNTKQDEGSLLEKRADLFLNIHRNFLRFCFRPVVDNESRDALLHDMMAEVNKLLGAESARIFVFEEGLKDGRGGEEYGEQEVWPPQKCEFYECNSRPSKGKSRQRKSMMEFTPESDIAWHAVNDKKVVNVIDRPKSERLISNIEKMYGHCVRNILSFPIHGYTKAIGAVNIINKLDQPNFTILDEEACLLMAEYVSFILNGASLAMFNNDRLLEVEIFQDMLSNKLIPSPKNVELLVDSDAFHVLPEGFSKFSWYPQDCEDLEEQLAYFMMKDLVDEALCPDRAKLAKLVIFTRNIYNPHCFHNFEHALNVLHCIYVIINRNVDKFRQLEVAALAVTALCHDAGRNGLRKRGMPPSSDSFESAYDAVYGYNNVGERVLGIIKVAELFDHLPSEEYQHLKDLVVECTTGSDITVSYEKRLKLKKLLESDEFDPEQPLHRSHLMVLIMSAADLSGLAKPIDIAMMVTRRIYEEFYEKGDLERAKGLCPLEKMNRDFSHKIHEQQLFYLSKMVKPVYEVINMVLNGTKPLLNGVETVIGADRSQYEALASYLEEIKQEPLVQNKSIICEIGCTD